MRFTAALILSSAMVLSAPATQAAYTPDPAPSPAAPTTPAAPAAPTTQEQPGATKSVQSELSRISTMIYRKDFKTARAELRVMDRAYPNDADVNNLLGYTSRKLKLYSSSTTYYRKALRINPDHLDALEYQGELFVVTKKMALARKNLVRLETLCGVNCSQYKDLKKVIDKKM